MYAQRDNKGVITGLFANAQPGFAEEWVDGAELPNPASTREQTEKDRLRAYADAVTGSDRYFAEVARLNATGGAAEEITAAQAAGVARYAEIQSQFPWPAK